MHPLAGIFSFLEYSTDNLTVIATTQEKCKPGYDPTSRKFYHIGDTLVSGGFSKTGVLGQNLQLGFQLLDRYWYKAENKSSEVQTHIIEEFTEIETLLINLESSLNIITDEHLKEEDTLDILKKTKDKLFQLKGMLGTAKIGLSNIFSLMAEDNKTEQALDSAGCEAKAAGLRVLTVNLLNKVIDILPLEFGVLDESPEVEVAETSSSLLMSGLTFAGAFVGGCFQATRDFITERYHFWKQHKWHLLLEQSSKALESEMKMSLKEMLVHLSKTDTTDSEQLTFIQNVKDILIILDSAYGRIDITDDRRKQNTNCIYALREAIESPIGNSTFSKLLALQHDKKLTSVTANLALDILLTFSYVRISKMDIYPFCDYIVHKVIDSGKKIKHEANGVELEDDHKVAGLKEDDFENIDHMDPNLGACRASVNVGKLFGATNFGFDPYLTSNSPFTLGKVNICNSAGVFKSVTVNRLGTPTIDFKTGLKAGCEINPEFKGYVEYCKKHGLKILYISLQNNLKKEAHRNAALQRLMMQYPNTFTVVVLDQDSECYKQSGEFAVPLMSNDEFTVKYFERMLSDEKGYAFPAAWKEDPNFISLLHKTIETTLKMLPRIDDEAFRKLISQKIVTVLETDPKADVNALIAHERMNNLTIQERKDIIELIHAQLGWALPSYSDADELSVVCKDAIDRAMKMMSLMLEMLVIAQGDSDNPEYERMIKVYTHAPALLVKKQALIEERLERLLSARKYLNMQVVKDFISNGSCELPINQQEHFDFKKPPAQRPGELALIRFNESLFNPFVKEIQETLFDKAHLDTLVDSYIESDYFMKFDSCKVLEEKLKEKLTQKFIFAAQAIQSSDLTPAERVGLKKIIPELIYFTLLSPHSQDSKISEESAAAKLEKYLVELAVNPKAFFNRIGDTNEYLATKKTLTQKMMRHCFFNIKSNALQNQIIVDPLYAQIANSPYLQNILAVGPSVPVNPALKAIFSQVSEISHPLEMLVLGEEAVKFVSSNKIDPDLVNANTRKQNLLRAQGVLTQMREALQHFVNAKNEAEANATLHKLSKLISPWTTIMNNLV